MNRSPCQDLSFSCLLLICETFLFCYCKSSNNYKATKNTWPIRFQKYQNSCPPFCYVEINISSLSPLKEVCGVRKLYFRFLVLLFDVVINVSDAPFVPKKGNGQLSTKESSGFFIFYCFQHRLFVELSFPDNWLLPFFRSDLVTYGIQRSWFGLTNFGVPGEISIRSTTKKLL